MTREDILPVVALQTAFLHGSYITELGPRFLTRFYDVALRQPATSAFVALDGNTIVGVALTTVDVHQFNSYVKPRIALTLAAALCPPRRWPLAARFVGALKTPEPAPYIPAELLLLVVHGDFRQRGIGRGLLNAVEQMYVRRNASIYRVAVRSQLEAARAFYKALGFVFEQEVMVLGQPMTYLTKHVGS